MSSIFRNFFGFFSDFFQNLFSSKISSSSRRACLSYHNLKGMSTVFRHFFYLFLLFLRFFFFLFFRHKMLYFPDYYGTIKKTLYLVWYENQNSFPNRLLHSFGCLFARCRFARNLPGLSLRSDRRRWHAYLFYSYDDHEARFAFYEKESRAEGGLYELGRRKRGDSPRVGEQRKHRLRKLISRARARTYYI